MSEKKCSDKKGFPKTASAVTPTTEKPCHNLYGTLNDLTECW